MGHQSEFGVQSVFEFIFTVLYLSLVAYPTKSQFQENWIYSFNIIKKLAKFLQKKDIC